MELNNDIIQLELEAKEEISKFRFIMINDEPTHKSTHIAKSHKPTSSSLSQNFVL
jgi:hypothetical protein